MIRIVLGAATDAHAARERLDAVARRLRDAGHEVIYLGGGAEPHLLVETAIDEDADLVVVWQEAGATDAHLAEIGRLLGERDAAEIAVRGGDDADALTRWIAEGIAGTS